MCICLCKGHKEDDKKLFAHGCMLCMTASLCEIRATLGRKKKPLQALNLCVGVCQSEGFLVGGGPDTDVKHDMVTAGKFTFPPPSACSLSHALLPSGQFWLACG